MVSLKDINDQSRADDIAALREELRQADDPLAMAPADDLLRLRTVYLQEAAAWDARAEEERCVVASVVLNVAYSLMRDTDMPLTDALAQAAQQVSAAWAAGGAR